MRLWVGFDVGKAFHWACAIDGEGGVLLSRRGDATEWDLEACLEEIAGLGDDRVFGIGLLGGPAALLEAVLLGAGERVFYLPGTAVNETSPIIVGSAAFLILLANSVRPTERGRVSLILRLDVDFPGRFRVQTVAEGVRVQTSPKYLRVWTEQRWRKNVPEYVTHRIVNGVGIGQGTSKPSIRSARLIPPRRRAIYDEAW